MSEKSSSFILMQCNGTTKDCLDRKRNLIKKIRNQTLADVLKIIDKRVNLHRNGDADLELTTWGFGSFIQKLKEEIKNIGVKDD